MTEIELLQQIRFLLLCILIFHLSKDIRYHVKNHIRRLIK